MPENVALPLGGSTSRCDVIQSAGVTSQIPCDVTNSSAIHRNFFIQSGGPVPSSRWRAHLRDITNPRAGRPHDVTELSRKEPHFLQDQQCFQLQLQHLLFKFVPIFLLSTLCFRHECVFAFCKSLQGGTMPDLPGLRVYSKIICSQNNEHLHHEN